jgi:hypothetical protein
MHEMLNTAKHTTVNSLAMLLMGCVEDCLFLLAGCDCGCGLTIHFPFDLDPFIFEYNTSSIIDS